MLRTGPWLHVRPARAAHVGALERVRAARRTGAQRVPRRTRCRRRPRRRRPRSRPRTGVSCPIAPAHTAATTPSAAAPTSDFSAVARTGPGSRSPTRRCNSTRASTAASAYAPAYASESPRTPSAGNRASARSTLHGVLDRVDEERRARVLLRVEPAQREQVDGERHESEREPLQHVSGDRCIARIEAAPHQDRNRGLREDRERDGRRYDDQQQVAEAEREVVAHAHVRRRLTRDARAPGVVVVMIETANRPCGSWKKMNAYWYAETSPASPVDARISTNSSAS